MNSNTDKLVNTLSQLGRIFHQVSLEPAEKTRDYLPEELLLENAIESAYMNNPWFIPLFVRFAFNAWAIALQPEKIRRWSASYGLPDLHDHERLTIGIIMAGNIPMVGLHDLICVLASGHNALARLSSSDDILIPAISEIICRIDPDLRERIRFTREPMKNFDAVIATGSNNSSRYFDYYFGRYPNIIRKNRNGIAVLTGEETEEDMIKLADDIFLYFGLGCRSISKIFVPEGYDFSKIFDSANRYILFSDHHKYRNDYDYQKSIMLINSVHHEDNGFLLIKQDQSFISPISVLHAEYYRSVQELSVQLTEKQDQVQCTVSNSHSMKNTIRPGQSQLPELWDYADGLDTLKFLMNL